MDNDAVLVIVVAAALIFAFTNGFRDTASVVATSISTRALQPRSAVALAAVLNFAGALISLEVATTIVEDIVEVTEINPTVVFAGVAGAIVWNLITWYLGLASSSSHALIGGLIGAALAAAGSGGVDGDGVVGRVLVPAVVVPAVALAVGIGAIAVCYRVAGRLRPAPAKRGYRLGQVPATGLLALAHGSNDAQKTMGVITLALIANGNLSPDGFEVPGWVVLAAATALAAGTYTGGWRIIRAMGARIIDMDVAQGFSAQGAGAAAILASSQFGYPVSTTQVMSGAVAGAGAGKRLSVVRWGLAGDVLGAWLLTLPAAAAIGAAGYGLARIFGTGAAGPLLVFALALALGLGLFALRIQRGQPVPSS